MCMLFYPQELQRNSLHFTSLQFTSLHLKTKSLHINHVSSPHITTLHITSLIYTQFPIQFPLFVTTFLALFLNVFSLQGKDASKPAGNWFQLLTVLFMKEYLSTTVLCFLVLINLNTEQMCPHMQRSKPIPRTFIKNTA